MTNPFENDNGDYLVLVNDERQYSLWPSFREIPAGWSPIGPRGKRQECLAWIDATWTDMRPKSLADEMDRGNSKAALSDTSVKDETSKDSSRITTLAEPLVRSQEQARGNVDDLVLRLSSGEHRVEVSIRPERTPSALKTRIDDGYILVKFTGTRGGTELGVQLDRESSDWSNADFENGKGYVTFCGILKLNYVPVKCVATIDIKTMIGTGHLEITPESDSLQ